MRDELDGPMFRPLGAKSIRFDLAPTEAAAPAVAEAGLLERFRAWVKTSARDRRAMPRHQARDAQLWLGWWRGNDAFFANPGRLVDISRGGASILIADPPPEGHPVWICLGEPDSNDCVPATVLEVRTVRRRDCAVRLAFAEPCPHAFFELAVCMLAAPKPRGTTRSPSDEDVA